MQVSVENLSSLGRRLIIKLPAEPIDQEVEKRLKKTAATAHIKGFRPGKAPLKTIKENYEGSIRFEVIDEQMRKSLGQALQEKNLTPAGMPQVNLTNIKPGEPLEFTAEFEIFPEIDFKSLTGANIEKIIPEILDTDLEETINAVRKQHTRFEKVERAAQNGDEIIIDFIGKVDGEPLENGAAEDTALVLGSHRFIAGFEEGLVGAKAGDDVTLNLTFPAEYHHKPIAGKPVTFEVKVKEVLEPRLPEIDETFLKMFNITEGGADAFRKEVRTNMEREVKQVAKNQLKQTVFDKLLELNTFDIPQALIDAEIDNLQQEAVKEMQAMYKNKSLPAIPKDIFAERARYRVKLGLLLREAHKALELKLDQSRVQQAVEEFASLYVNPEEATNWIKNNKQKMREIEALTLEEQLIDKLLEAAHVVEKKETYSHLMKKQNHEHHDHHHEHGPDCNHDHDHEHEHHD